MADMLVRLYDLPPVGDLSGLADEGIEIRRPLAPDKMDIVSWVKDKFGNYWGSECDVAFSRQPVSCFVAVKEKKVIGFACYETTHRSFFGPTGVDEEYRGKGIGKVLLLKCLHEMYNMGYAYAFIGGAGPKDFYNKIVGAIEIEDSTPGIYRNMVQF